MARTVWTDFGALEETGARTIWGDGGAREETAAGGGGSLAPAALAAGASLGASSFTQSHVFTGAALSAGALLGVSSFLQDHLFQPANLLAGTILSSGSWPGMGGDAPSRGSLSRRLPIGRRRGRQR